jgi:hypothetical protein
MLEIKALVMRLIRSTGDNLDLSDGEHPRQLSRAKDDGCPASLERKQAGRHFAYTISQMHR